MPAISVPIGRDGSGAGIVVQLISRSYDEGAFRGALFVEHLMGRNFDAPERRPAFLRDRG